MAVSHFPHQLIFDFDSTLVSLEGLDELARIVLAGDPNREAKVAEIEHITNLGMAGEINFATSLRRRLELVTPSRHHIDAVTALLANSISPSITAHKDFFQQHAANIWVVSGGFVEWIVPIMQGYGIAPDHVFANAFTWNDDESLATGYDTANPLAGEGGKIEVVRQLGLDPAGTIMIGDGMTDYAIREAGLASTFIAYSENVRREPVIAAADAEAATFDELLAIIKHQP